MYNTEDRVLREEIEQEMQEKIGKQFKQQIDNLKHQVQSLKGQLSYLGGVRESLESALKHHEKTIVGEETYLKIIDRLIEELGQR